MKQRVSTQLCVPPATPATVALPTVNAELQGPRQVARDESVLTSKRYPGSFFFFCPTPSLGAAR